MEKIEQVIAQYEDIVTSLQEFSTTNEENEHIELAIQSILLTGHICFPWELIKPVLIFKIQNLYKTFGETEQTEYELIDKAIAQIQRTTYPPFTTQRLVESIFHAKTFYARLESCSYALVRLTRVNSCIEVVDKETFKDLAANLIAKMEASTTENVPVQTVEDRELNKENVIQLHEKYKADKALEEEMEEQEQG